MKKFKHQFWANMKLTYGLFFVLLTPLVVCVLPVIPYVLTNNEQWMWFLIVTIPAGMSLLMILWE